MKRNDVVFVGSFYGRINRKVDDEHYEIVDAGRYFRILHVSEFEHTPEYKGKWSSWNHRDEFVPDNPKFYRMHSLRKLKQLAARFDKKVWKKHRKAVDYTTEVN